MISKPHIRWQSDLSSISRSSTLASRSSSATQWTAWARHRRSAWSIYSEIISSGDSFSGRGPRRNPRHSRLLRRGSGHCAGLRRAEERGVCPCGATQHQEHRAECLQSSPQTRSGLSSQQKNWGPLEDNRWHEAD